MVAVCIILHSEWRQGTLLGKRQKAARCVCTCYAAATARYTYNYSSCMDDINTLSYQIANVSYYNDMHTVSLLLFIVGIKRPPIPYQEIKKSLQFYLTRWLFSMSACVEIKI